MIYDLTAQVTVSVYTRVQASCLEEAIKIAEDRSIETSQFNSEEQQCDTWVSYEFDGEPLNIKEAE